MEVKCECPRSTIVTVTCTCDQHSSSCTNPVQERQGSNSNSRSNNTGAFYWQRHPICINSDKLTRSIEYSNGGRQAYPHTTDQKSNDSPSKSVMASWRYPASACFAPCINTRRLNRTYSEQRMRCLLTTTVAFCLGISVGALLPFFFPPVDILSSSSLSPNPPVTEPILSIQVENILTPRQQKLMVPTLVEEVVTARPLQALLDSQNISLRSPVTFVDNPVISTQDKENGNVGAESSVKVSSSNGGDGLQLANGIYWSDWVERLLPKGYSEEDVSNWRWLASNSTVTTVEAGCGRMQNRLITYENGKKACCRYRQNFDQIQGEIFSFYLSQLLGIKNLVPSTLDVIESKSFKWKSVRDELQSAQWVDDKPVVLTQFVNNLSPAFIPSLLRSSTRRVHPPDLPSPQLLLQLSQSGQVNSTSESKGAFDEISELAQWSDLIIFDYLTANLDRMVNNLYNLQWNPTMMEAPAHNLAKDTSTGLLVFLDNESGLLHGYRLLDKYEHYHRLMLDSLCVFRKSTADAIRRLRSYGSIQPLFKSMLSQFKRSQLLPMIPDKSIKVLNQRIDTVYRQIQKCQSLYSNRTGNNNNTNNNST